MSVSRKFRFANRSDESPVIMQVVVNHDHSRMVCFDVMALWFCLNRICLEMDQDISTFELANMDNEWEITSLCYEVVNKFRKQLGNSNDSYGHCSAKDWNRLSKNVGIYANKYQTV